MKPVTGKLIINGNPDSRCFRWEIYTNIQATINGRIRPFKRQQTARNDAIRIAKRLGISLVEEVP
jgi:hypothetical protein